jgi:hypothetical protein
MLDKLEARTCENHRRFLYTVRGDDDDDDDDDDDVRLVFMVT